MCLMLIKVSFFLFYRRLFRPVAHVQVMIWVGISLVVAFAVVYTIILPIACAPWPSEQDGWMDMRMATRCATMGFHLILARCYFSILTDFYILIIPMHQVPHLRLSMRRKIGISFIFLTGLLHGEIAIGLIALSMPVVLAQFVGRLTDLGKSLSSWIHNLRTPPQSNVDNDNESYSNLAGEAEADEDSQRQGEAEHPRQQLPPQKIPNATLSGMRKFIRNLQRSRAAASSATHRGSTSAHDAAYDDNSNYLRTFDDLTSADFSYHIQLKAMRASESTLGVERGRKVGDIHSTRGYRE
ncbi:hypothetical protein PG988_016142 [Apiospora saccharicola]